MERKNGKYTFYRQGDWYVCDIIARRYHVHPKRMIFLFTPNQFNTMIDNYTLGKCPISEKGLYRYSNAYGIIPKLSNSRELLSRKNFKVLCNLTWRNSP